MATNAKMKHESVLTTRDLRTKFPILRSAKEITDTDLEMNTIKHDNRNED